MVLKQQLYDLLERAIVPRPASAPWIFCWACWSSPMCWRWHWNQRSAFMIGTEVPSRPFLGS